jgi:hypothetical protein
LLFIGALREAGRVRRKRRGFGKEIDHLLVQVAEIEKCIDLDKKIAA